MPAVRPIEGNLPGGGRAVQLLLTEGEVRLLASDPSRAMMEIEIRATTVSRVLEQILREPHGEPDWGLNE